MSQIDIVQELKRAASNAASRYMAGTPSITDDSQIIMDGANTITQLRERLDAVENERLPHMCRADHVEIRHADSTSELCPLCRSNNMITQLRLSNERMREALKKLRRRDFPDDEEALWDEIQAALTAESGTEGKG